MRGCLCAIPPLVTATIVAGGLAEIECADVKTSRQSQHSDILLFNYSTLGP